MDSIYESVPTKEPTQIPDSSSFKSSDNYSSFMEKDLDNVLEEIKEEE